MMYIATRFRALSPRFRIWWLLFGAAALAHLLITWLSHTYSMRALVTVVAMLCFMAAMLGLQRTDQVLGARMARLAASSGVLLLVIDVANIVR